MLAVRPTTALHQSVELASRFIAATGMADAATLIKADQAMLRLPGPLQCHHAFLVERGRLMAEKIRKLVEVQLPLLVPVEGAAGVAGIVLTMPSSQRSLASSRL